MKRFLLAIVTFLVLSASANAAHIIGGEMRYVYLGPGGSPNTNSYRILLILFRDADGGGATLANSYVVGIYNNDNGQKVVGTAANNNWLVNQDNPPGILPVPIIFPSCIGNPPIINYEYATYSLIIDLPQTLTGYTVVYQTCCRINGMINVGNSTGVTYNCIIPGSNTVPSGNDSSPQFGLPVNVVCKNAPFTLNFGAIDPNGDSLQYSFCDAYNGGAAVNTGFTDPAPPPYGSVIYNPPYTGTQPLGGLATINSATGVITGIAPDFGRYVVCVCINVYRNGVLIATHRKDLIVQVSDCVITQAVPMPSFVTCDGFNIQFSHTSSGANTVFWDFGDPSTLADTSILDSPTYTYPVAGTYTVKFIINRGTSCVDSTTRTIGVFPGFFPGFTTAGSCITNPFQFTDTTRTNYGVVDTWSWNFGDLTTLADTSHLQNPQWTYSTPGPKDVTLTVTNSKGCINTAQVTIDVLAKPLITLAFNDALICIPDSITLNASGTGNFSWTPPVNIINANTSTPTVYPVVDTWYVVNLNDNGCVNQDSVHVRVTANVSLLARADTTICLTDPVQLNATGNGLAFQWSPAGTLNNPNIANPIATPTGTVTTYQVRATIGSCFADDDVTITTVPYPIATTGPDQIVCYNKSAQLNASHNGISFSWSPVSYLNDPNILNPVASPPRTTAYILTVFDNKGCPKPGKDTIIVTVNPRVRAYAGRDTIVVVNQPLQFTGSGGVNYLWSPATGLTNTTIYNPIGVYGINIDSVRYKLVVSDAAGCADSAFVIVRVYKVNPTIFVPTAFTPNGDGLNETVYPISVGIKKINHFSIYNRWGELVFTTTQDRKGWDGRIAGILQSSNVFVWMVRAIDYLGTPIFLKGTVTLIR